MGVEVVSDKVPTDSRQIRLDRALDVIDKIFLGSCVSIGGLYDVPGCHFKVDHEALGAVTFVLELLPFGLAPRHRQFGILAFQGLHATQFIHTKRPFALLGQFWSLAIQGIDVLNLLLKLLVRNRCQPVPYQMGFEIAIFLKASPRVGARLSPGYLVP